MSQEITKHFGRPIEYTEERIKQLADELRDWADKPDSLFLEDFAFDRNIPRQVLSELAEQDNYFSDAYKLAKQKQTTRIATNGLKGKFNAQMSKFTLMNVAGWRENQSTDITSSGQQLGYVALPNVIDIEDAEILD